MALSISIRESLYYATHNRISTKGSCPHFTRPGRTNFGVGEEFHLRFKSRRFIAERKQGTSHRHDIKPDKESELGANLVAYQ
ncbi:hypothetical protein J6590_011557 [Homalodisca vitripennis]|nr:hypothetical protein J6590_011557 [Homalodisca vitripennis]